jgi:ParB-like chromosome segregation protein Spo0J
LGEELPLVPVIRRDMVRKYLDDELLEEFERFERQNPVAEYFMLDGSHRTTTLNLAGCSITAIIYETDADIEEAKRLVATGQVLQNATLEHSLEENCGILNRHYKEKPYFMTVEQKTEKMKRENKLPQEMTDSCR